MGLLDGGIAETFAAVFGGIYLDGSLFRANAFTDDGKGGGTGGGLGLAEPVKVQIDQASFAMQQSDGYVEGDVRILMLAHGIDQPNTDCELGAGGVRYSIQSISKDPAGSYFEMRGRTISHA